MTERKRIAFIVDSLFPYRLSFYEKLYSHQEYDWMFFHGIKEIEDGRPAYRGALTFPNQAVGYKAWKVGPFFVRWQAGLIGQLTAWQPQVVIAQGIPSILSNWLVLGLARLRGAKTIIWHCGWESQTEHTLALKVKQWFARLYLRLADRAVLYSTKAAKYLAALSYPPERMTVCYNGLEIDSLLANEEEIRAKGLALRASKNLDTKKLFLYVGGMMADKQVPLLLDAFKAIDCGGKAELWLVGDGPDLASIKRIAETKGLTSVTFLGRVIDDVDVFFAAADFFVLPGVGGLALNQALFWRVPCVVGDADGTEDDLVIDGRTGFRFAAKDARSLEHTLISCMQLGSLDRGVLGSAGRDLVLRRSNVNQMVNTFMNSINELSAA